jgi:hypothetical protein
MSPHISISMEGRELPRVLPMRCRNITVGFPPRAVLRAFGPTKVSTADSGHYPGLLPMLPSAPGGPRVAVSLVLLTYC